MVKAVIASKNRDKVAEIKEILAMPGLELVTFEEVGVWPEVEETGSSFCENAMIKAKELAGRLGIAALADDSGLEVDALGGAPGVRSARYAGAGADDRANNEKLLKEVAEIPGGKRTARFKCCAVYFNPRGRVLSAEGTLEGEIGREPRGGHGFGYDPLFIPAGHSQTLAELGSEVKNEISHRAKAFRLLRLELEELVGRG